MTAPIRATAVALLALSIGGATLAQDLPLPLRDPTTGASASVEAGPGALHVVLFATWCPPCVEELDRLSQLEARWGEIGYRLVVVAVNTRQDEARLARFAASNAPPGRLLFDADGAVQRRLGASELPAHFVFDGSGARVATGGELDARLEAAIEALVREAGRK